MKNLMAMLAVCTLAAGLLLQASPAHAQATRTWVSGVGDDANPCSRTAPCKTFAGAISKTAVNGIINCLDSGGFGGVTITKSITLECASVTAGVLVSGTNAINVIVGATDTVVLRGLQIEGIGSGLIGVNFTGAGTLRIEASTISGFVGGSAWGVNFAPSGGGALYVTDTSISDNGTAATGGGIRLRPTGASGANAALTRVTLNHNGQGLLVDGSGGTGATRAQIMDSMISGNRNAGITSLQTAGTGGALTMVERTMIAQNGTYGAVANGPDAHMMLSNATIAVNSPGVGFLNGGHLYTYDNNSINANIGSDGTPIANVLGRN